MIESGPAAGVIGAAPPRRGCTGRADVITLDMGGTTAKAAIIEDGEPARTTEYEVGAGINLRASWSRAAATRSSCPSSTSPRSARAAAASSASTPRGSVAVGPRSAGADPGPACYGRGGTEPTLTDALLVLGYLNARHSPAARVTLDAALAREALERARRGAARRSARRRPRTASYTLAAATMTRAVKAVTTYRGRDPRDFALLRVRRQRPAAGGRDRPRAADPPGARPAGARRLQRARPALLRHRARVRADPHAPRPTSRAPTVSAAVRRARAPSRASIADDTPRRAIALRRTPTSATPARPTSSPCLSRPGPSTSPRRGQDFVAEHPDLRPRRRRRSGRVVSIRAVARVERTAAQALRPGCGDPLARAAREREAGLLRAASTASSRRRCCNRAGLLAGRRRGPADRRRDTTRPASSRPTARALDALGNIVIDVDG